MSCPKKVFCLALLLTALGQAQPSASPAASTENRPRLSSYTRDQLQTLPLSPGFWGIVQSLEPTSVIEPLDFGGLAADFLPLVSFEAGSWTGIGYRFNGLNVSDPYQPGRAIFLPDPNSIGEFDVQHSTASLPVHSLGSALAVAIRKPEQDWHGAFSSLFTDSALAASNLSESAIRAGLNHSEQFRWFTRDHVELGGRIGQRTDLFLSGTGQWASQRVPREPGESWLSSRQLLAATRGGVRLSPRDRIQAAVSASRLDRWGYGFPVGFEPLVGRRMAPPFQLHRDSREEDHLDSGRLSWVRESSSGGPLFELRYGLGIAHLDSDSPLPSSPLAESTQTRIELTDGSLRGPPPLTSLGVRTRHHVEAVWRGEEFAIASSRHRPRAGGHWQRSKARNRLNAAADTHLILAAGQPASVAQLNTPLDSRGRTVVYGFHVADAVRLDNWLSVEASLVGEHVRGSLPDQSSPAGMHYPARRFSEERTPLTWTTLAPRAAVVLSLPWSFGPQLRASYARYYYPPSARHLDFANPNSLSGEEFRWTDNNGDLLWQPGETGSLLRRFGGIHSGIDDSLERPYVEEFAVGAGARLPLALRGNLRLFRRDHRQRMAAVNTGVPFQFPAGGPSYTPTTIQDPGPDFISGTFDDQSLTVYDQDPSTFGNDRYLLTNADLSSFSAGLVAQLSGAGQRYWWRLTFTAEKGHGTNAFGNDAWQNDSAVIGSLLHDPNVMLNATGRPFFDRAFIAKHQSSFQLPSWLGGVDVGTSTSYWDGLPFGRRLLVDGLEQGPAMVLATVRGSPEGGHRTEFHLTLDLRLSREFELLAGSLRILTDVFNLLNTDNKLLERDLSGPAFNERIPLAIQPPRFVRVGMEYSF